MALPRLMLCSLGTNMTKIMIASIPSTASKIMESKQKSKGSDIALTQASQIPISENIAISLPLWRRNNPAIQLSLIGACLFCNPGLYLAITGLGAGGGKASSVSTADVSNGVLYGVFVFSALAGGTYINVFGPRLTTMFGITGYPIYTGSFWYYGETGHSWFPIFSGAYLGLTAGALWSVAGFMAMTYPEEKDKGLWRALQWCCNTAGAMVGAIVALSINVSTNGTAGVPNSVYIVFIIVQSCSVVFAALMCPPGSLIRYDGSRVAEVKQETVRQTTKALWETMKDYRIRLMIPAFFAGEIFLVLQSSMNAYAFDLRARSLNNVLTNVVQIPFTLFVGWILDNERFGSRRRRGMIAVAFDATWVTGTYIAQTAWFASWKFDRSIAGPSIDWSDSAYPGAVIIYVCYGAQYGIFQNTMMWLMGAMTNQPKTLAHMGGIFVGVLSAGTACAFGIDASSVPYENENGAYFALATLSWPILFYIADRCITDSNYFKEDGVGVPVHVQLEKDHIIGRDVVNIQGVEQRKAASALEKL